MSFGNLQKTRRGPFQSNHLLPMSQGKFSGQGKVAGASTTQKSLDLYDLRLDKAENTSSPYGNCPEKGEDSFRTIGYMHLIRQ
jgi:hypothetical protein